VLINSSAYFENGKFVHTRCFTRDVTDQLRAERGLRQLAAIVESTDDVIIAKDLNGIVTSWNAAAEKLYGYTAEEMIGKPISILIPPENPDEEPTILAKLHAGERIDHYESVRIAKDGRRINVSLTVSPIRDASGKIVGASKIARDITDIKRAQVERERLLEREEKARAQAEAANRVKDEFLATLSHELRTPLNAIMGWAGMLRGNKLSPTEVTRAIEIIDRNAKVQSRLIEGVLDVSRIVSGKFQIECRPVQLPEVITAAVDSVRPAADARNLRLQVVIEPQLAMVAGDFNRLQQVVWNLLSNAVKFTEPGGEIKVKLRTTEKDVEIVVSDTGHGISRDFLPHVFDRFRQADSSTTRKHGGLGLGLAIVRHLVELHGGSVEAESPGVGKGAIFRVRLPKLTQSVAESLEQSTDETEAATSLRLLRGLRILVVEDEDDARDLLVEMLSTCEADVKAASSALEALELFNLWKPHVLVSDISMPEMDGYALLERVKSMASNGGVPAIAVTAHAGEEDRNRAISAGFRAYLPKPVALPELAMCIAQATGRLSSSMSDENDRDNA
jgi:PAS domain S-box-containing protein